MSIRPGRLADLEAWMALERAAAAAGEIDSVPTGERLEGMLREFDWTARSRAVEEVGAVQAMVLVLDRPTAEGTVARAEVAGAVEHHRALLEWSLGLARAAGAARLQVWRGKGRGKGLDEIGFEPARPFWRMDRADLESIPDLRLPAPYRLLTDGDPVPIESWVEVYNQSFAEHWRHTPTTAEVVRQRQQRAGRVPGLALLAVDEKGAPAAHVVSLVESYDPDPRPQPVGIVATVGTLPGHRRRGLGAALTAEALRRLRGAGAASASLYVDGLNASRAYDLYRKLGFEVGYEFEVWEAAFS